MSSETTQTRKTTTTAWVVALTAVGSLMAALNDVADTATATAYSLGQQLAVTAWNIAFAVVIVIWAFGWAGGRVLVESSYADAKVKVAEESAQRAAKRAARRKA